MAREIVLRLAVRNFERARDLITQVAERAQRTLATAKEVTADLRAAGERAQKTSEARARSSLAREIGGAGPLFDPGTFRPLGMANNAREKGMALGNAIFGDKEPVKSLPTLMMMSGALVPGLGPFMAFLAPLTEKLVSHFEERLAQELARREASLVARMDEDRFRSDYSRRFAEDPTFRREQARQAFEQHLAEEARRGARSEPVASDLVSDFGL